MNLKRAKPCPYCEVAKELKNNFVKLEKKCSRFFRALISKQSGFRRFFLHSRFFHGSVRIVFLLVLTISSQLFR